MKSGGKNVLGNIQVSYDPAIPFLRIYPTEMCTYVHQKPSTRRFTLVSFVIGKNRNQGNVNRTNTGIFTQWNAT